MMLVVTPTRTVITAFTLVSVLALGACSDDDPEPKFAPTPSTSAPTEESTSPASPSDPVEPSMPTEATRDSDAGAEAFVRYWIEMVNFAQRTGQTNGLRKLNDVRCAGCRGMVEAIDSAYRSGGHIVGGALSAGRLRELPLDFGAEWAAFANAKTAPQTVVRQDGTEEKHNGAPFDLYTYVDWNDGWSMRWLRTPS
jgi:hypothetical protein